VVNVVNVVTVVVGEEEVVEVAEAETHGEGDEGIENLIAATGELLIDGL